MIQERQGCKEQYRYPQPDVLVVLGRNIGSGWDQAKILEQETFLSPHSRLNVLAAALIYKPGMKIIFSGGETTEGAPAEGRAMKDYFLDLIKDRDVQPKIDFEKLLEDGVFERDLPTEETSWSTGTNGKQVKKILERLNLPSTALLSVDKHAQNATNIFRRVGVRVTQTIVAEEILRKFSPIMETQMDKYSQTIPVIRDQQKEETRTRLLRLGRVGIWAMEQGTRRSGRKIPK